MFKTIKPLNPKCSTSNHTKMSCHHHSATTTTTYCHCYYPPYPPCHYHSPPPPDPHLLHHPPPQPHLYPPQPHLPNSHQYHPHYQDPSERQALDPTVSSLLRRIDALESALSRRSTSSSTSLRDAAARTIQTYFRAFLVRRSRTLRQLKDLAFIKSKLSILKSSVSRKAHFDYDVVYRRAVDLLRKLNAIQGGDPMIRDGKSSVRRELNGFLDYIDEFCSERRGLSSRINVRYERNTVKSKVPIRERKMSNVKCGDLRRDNMQKLSSLVERIDKLAEELDEEESEVIESPNVFTRKHTVAGNTNGVLVKHHGGVQPKVKKSVSFAEDGKVYRVLRRNRELDLDDDFEDNLVDTERNLVDDLGRQVEEIGVSSKEANENDDDEEVNSENGDSLPSSDEFDKFTFSAPMPLEMATRVESIDKRKTH